MNALTVRIPQRLSSLALPGHLQPIEYRPALQPVLFSRWVGRITIPIFPTSLIGLTDEFLAFITDENGNKLTW